MEFQTTVDKRRLKLLLAALTLAILAFLYGKNSAENFVQYSNTKYYSYEFVPPTEETPTREELVFVEEDLDPFLVCIEACEAVRSACDDSDGVKQIQCERDETTCRLACEFE
jgi:hypothetical protein